MINFFKPCLLKRHLDLSSNNLPLLLFFFLYKKLVSFIKTKVPSLPIIVKC